MKSKSLIICAIVSALCLMNLNYSYVFAEKIKLKDIFKKKNQKMIFKDQLHLMIPVKLQH